MSRREFYKDESGSVRDAASAIRSAFLLQRRAGKKSDESVETVADLFQMTPRRVQAWLYDQIVNPTMRECRLISRRWWIARDLEVARLRALADSYEQELERERIAAEQLEFRWGTAVNAEKRESRDNEASAGHDRGTANAMGDVARRLERFSKAEAAYRKQRQGPLK